MRRILWVSWRIHCVSCIFWVTAIFRGKGKTTSVKSTPGCSTHTSWLTTSKPPISIFPLHVQLFWVLFSATNDDIFIWVPSDPFSGIILVLFCTRELVSLLSLLTIVFSALKGELFCSLGFLCCNLSMSLGEYWNLGMFRRIGFILPRGKTAILIPYLARWSHCSSITHLLPFLGVEDTPFLWRYIVRQRFTLLLGGITNLLRILHPLVWAYLRLFLRELMFSSQEFIHRVKGSSFELMSPLCSWNWTILLLWCQIFFKRLCRPFFRRLLWVLQDRKLYRFPFSKIPKREWHPNFRKVWVFLQ